MSRPDRGHVSGAVDRTVRHLRHGHVVGESNPDSAQGVTEADPRGCTKVCTSDTGNQPETGPRLTDEQQQILSLWQSLSVEERCQVIRELPGIPDEAKNHLTATLKADGGG